MKAGQFDDRCRSPLSKRRGRRKFLKALGGGALAASMIGMPAIVRAQERTIQFWSTQRGTTQRAAYKNIIDRFQAAYPQYKVNIEVFGAEQTWEKLTAGFAARNVPDLISHLPAPPIIQLNEEGLIEPFDDIINAVGKDDFFPRALEIYRDRKTGRHSAATVVNQTPTNLWVRTDLFAKAGLAAPKTWEDLLKVSKTLTKDGIYGTVYPMGKTDMGTIMAIMTIWLAGGRIVNPDLSLAFNSPETIAALEFAKEIFPSSPPDSASYGYDQAINSFVTGRVATTPYTGRIIQNIQEQNPGLGDSITVVPYPVRAGVTPAATSVTSFSNLFIPKGGKSLEGAKLFATWLYRKDNYIEFLHSAPGHNLPILKSIGQSKEFTDHPLLLKYRKELDIMIANMATGRELLQETDQHQFNKKAGEIYSTRILTEIFQDVLVGGMSPKDAAARGADRIARLMKG